MQLPGSPSVGVPGSGQGLRVRYGPAEGARALRAGATTALAPVGSQGWVWMKEQMWPRGWEAPALSWALRHLGVCIWRRRTLQETLGGGSATPHTHLKELYP